jgi:hypothetical protein
MHPKRGKMRQIMSMMTVTMNLPSILISIPSGGGIMITDAYEYHGVKMRTPGYDSSYQKVATFQDSDGIMLAMFLRGQILNWVLDDELFRGLQHGFNMEPSRKDILEGAVEDVCDAVFHTGQYDHQVRPYPFEWSSDSTNWNMTLSMEPLSPIISIDDSILSKRSSDHQGVETPSRDHGTPRLGLERVVQSGDAESSGADTIITALSGEVKMTAASLLTISDAETVPSPVRRQVHDYCDDVLATIGHVDSLNSYSNRTGLGKVRDEVISTLEGRLRVMRKMISDLSDWNDFMSIDSRQVEASIRDLGKIMQDAV